VSISACLRPGYCRSDPLHLVQINGSTAHKHVLRRRIETAHEIKPLVLFLKSRPKSNPANRLDVCPARCIPPLSWLPSVKFVRAFSGCYFSIFGCFDWMDAVPAHKTSPTSIETGSQQLLWSIMFNNVVWKGISPAWIQEWRQFTCSYPVINLAVCDSDDVCIFGKPDEKWRDLTVNRFAGQFKGYPGTFAWDFTLV